MCWDRKLVVHFQDFEREGAGLTLRHPPPQLHFPQYPQALWADGDFGTEHVLSQLLRR